MQSCTVYKKTPGTFDEAIATETNKIKAIKIDGSKQIIRGIRKNDSIYYGIVQLKGKKTKIILNKKDYSQIYLQDKENSTILTVGLISLTIATCVVIGLSSPNSMISNSFSP